MRNTICLSIGVLIVGAACSRPVLYYPAPAAAPAASEPQPVLAGAPAAPVGDGAARECSGDERRGLSRRAASWCPVAGADMSKVEDSFNEDRDGGERTHRAIDILAPRGTPILSADDGKILRMTTNTLGGITMYTVDPPNRLVYYYAHMDHYNDAMSPGPRDRARRHARLRRHDRQRAEGHAASALSGHALAGGRQVLERRADRSVRGARRRARARARKHVAGSRSN